MTLAELFAQLSRDELSNLALANGGNGTIKEEKHAALVDYTNTALLKLYTKFVLKEKDVFIRLYDHITFYHLLPQFSKNYVPSGSSDSEKYRYILGLPGELFVDDVIKITKVFTKSGTELPLNNESEMYSVFTPREKTLQVGHPRADGVLSVVYQAQHAIIQGNLDEKVQVPGVLKEALTSYIAYKVFSHINSVDSTKKAQEFYANYKETCASVKESDLVNTSISQSNTRFQRAGWI